LDGEKVGDDKVMKHYKDYYDVTYSEFQKGDCEAAGYGKNPGVTTYPYDGVTASNMYKFTAEEIAKQKKAAADKKAAAQKAAEEEKAAIEKDAEKEAEEEKKKKEANVWDTFHGDAHFIQNNYCIQLNGKMAGNEENYKTLYNKVTDISPMPPLEVEDCSEIGYTRKVGTYNMSVDGVDASIWLRAWEPLVNNI